MMLVYPLPDFWLSLTSYDPFNNIVRTTIEATGRHLGRNAVTAH